MYYNTKITYYSDEIEISRYSYTINRADVRSDKKHEDNKNDVAVDEQLAFDSEIVALDNEKNDKINCMRSLRRSKQVIYNIARANKWDYFVTFTFASDRYNLDSCRLRLRVFLNNFKKRRCNKLEYLCIPEQHKDGAWHFHGLLQGELSPFLVNAWNNGKYSLKDYRFGLCELEPVKDTHRVSSYITKYITKDVINSCKNKSRYMVSKGVKRGDDKFMQLNNDIGLSDFVLGNFPEYDMMSVKTVDYGEERIIYIQLKK